MAVTASGLFYPTLAAVFANTSAIDFTSTGNKWALISNSATPNFDTHDAWADLSANEVSGTGWSAGGIALAGGSIANSVSGQMVFDATDISETGTTLTNARAVVLYADAITTPTADPLLVLVDFEADYSTVSGTFAVQWTAPGSGGVFYIDHTPA